MDFVCYCRLIVEKQDTPQAAEKRLRELLEKIGIDDPIIDGVYSTAVMFADDPKAAT